MKAGKVVVSHPHGNANVRAVLRALEGQGMLERFVTTIGLSERRPIPAWVPGALRRELGRRVYPLLAERIAAAPLREAVRLASLRLKWGGLTAHERGWACVDAVWRETDRRAAARLEGAGAAYAYEDGALETFREAGRRGIARFYDLPIGYHEAAQRLFQEERELMPEFASSLTGLRDSPEKLERKREELALADTVIACSPFVAETLAAAGAPPGKIRLVQFGAPERPPLRDRPSPGPGEPLRVLFAGRIGQRKGIGYLLRALERLRAPEIRLTLLGEVEGPADFLRPHASLFDHLPPRPQAEVFAAMERHDLFVLPSLFEGQALAVLEAMKCGLPVVVTPNTGTAHLVEEGRNGFVVPIRSAEAISGVLEWALRNRGTLREMGRAARETADGLTWHAYENKIAGIVRDGIVA